MTKKQKLQEEAKDLEGYSDSLTIAKLEELIEKNKKPEEPKEEDPEFEPETSEDSNAKEGEKNLTSGEVSKISTVKMKRGERELSFEGDKENIIVGEKYTRENDPRAGGYYTIDQDRKEGYISAEDFKKENEK